MRRLLSIIAAACATAAVAAPPTPPLGQRWILNDTYSDEFNGPKLNAEKWYDYHPTWIGRAPGLFERKNVAIEDGCLVLSGALREEPHIVVNSAGDSLIFDISCAAVVSKKEGAHYGYYETRAKANKTSLSTTFWLSRGGTHPVEGNQPEGWAAGRFGQELDICETIGRAGSEEEGWKTGSSAMHKGMNANVHFWYSPDVGERVDIPTIKIPQLQPQNGVGLSEDFHIYGCWWKDGARAEFYLDNVSGGENIFTDRKSGLPFYQPKPMGVNMVVETYGWIPRPTDEDLSDPSKNKSYYDWVRHYILVPIDVAPRKDAPEQREVFEDYISINRTRSERHASGVTLTLEYSAPIDRGIIVEIESGTGEVVASERFNAYAGFGHGEYRLPARLNAEEQYSATVYITKWGASKSKGYFVSDSFEL